jgi:hypothetical protein
MNRATRFRLVCNGLALLMLLVGTRQLVDPILALADPLLATAQLNCSPCAYDIDPVRLLDRPLQRQAWQLGGVEQRILERLQEPHVPWLVFGSEAVRSIPLSVLFLALALGIRGFAAAGFSPGSIRWFRVSAVTALVWTAAGPVSRSMRASAFDVVLTGAEKFRFPIDFYSLIQGILIAGAALVALWAVEEATALRSSAEDYV